ncbi:MAG: hypothetical protein QOI43_1281 [Gaiellales bacterium]|nr:hypothetical protein [Gaiellales bacterium]
MRRVIVRYTVRPEHVEQNEALVRSVYDELERTRPSGLRYATFRLGDGGEFVHLASTETADGSNPLQQVAAFQAFQAGIGQRCVEPPVVTELHEIGSFRYWSADEG